MSLRKPLFRRFALFALACAALGVTWILSYSSLMKVLESKTLDYRFRLLPDQGVASPDILIAEIDDNSIKHLEPVFGRWPWTRDVHALFLRFMKQAGARVVVYDVLFTERDTSNPEADELFASETREASNVVHSVFLGEQDNAQVTGASNLELLKRFTIPRAGKFLDFIQADLPLVSLARDSILLGHVANVLDSDGPFRHYLVMASYKDRSLPSLALAAAAAASGIAVSDIKVGKRSIEAGNMSIPLNRDWRLPIWFNGGPGTYRTVSYSHVVYSQLQIEEGQEPGLDPEQFRNKIVLVGLTATGLHDLFTTPYAGSAGESARTSRGVRLGKMSGVEVHANVVDDLLNGRFLTRVSGVTAWALCLLLALTVLILIFYTRLSVAVAGSLASLGIYLGITYFAFTSRIQLPAALVGLSWGLAVAIGFAYQYWVEGAEKRAVKAIFSRYVSRDVYERLMNDPSAADLGGHRMMVSVLFSDLRGFTSLSENREPEDIVDQLNEYFSEMVELVFQHRGTVDKFVGDMIMALFNAPLPDGDHADHAVECALAMQVRLAELNAGWKKREMPSLASGVGINSGEMIAGNVGAESIQSYTVIGDNVNLGARLESLCKRYQTPIIISEYTRSLLKRAYDLSELGDVVVKGRTKPVKIFAVRPKSPLSIKEPADPER